MGLNENVTYNILKEKGLYSDISGSSQRKEFRSSFLWGPQIENKKHTKRNSRFQKQKRINFNDPSRSQNRPCGSSWSNLTSCFSMFYCWSVPDPGTPSMGPTHCYCLKKSYSLPVLQAALPSWAKASQECFKLQDILSNSLQWPSPLPNSWEQTCTTSPPTTRFVSIHFLLSSSLSLGQCG